MFALRFSGNGQLRQDDPIKGAQPHAEVTGPRPGPPPDPKGLSGGVPFTIMVRRTKRHRIRLWALFRLMMMTALFVAATGGPRGGQGLFWGSASGFVIAPPWANEATNPCSRESWQLIYWPPDGSCHQIFDRGPCPETQELAFNDLSLVAECRCPKGLLYWPETDR